MKPGCQNGSSPDPSVVTPFGSRNDRVPFYNNFTTFSLHIRVLYWAIATMSSMGYANAPVPIADIDYCYAIMTQVVGACLAAAIFSNIAQMINKRDAAGARYQMQLAKINEFMRLYKLSPSMCAKLHGYNDLLFTVNRGFDLNQIASMFPKSVQEDIFYDLHHTLIRQARASSQFITRHTSSQRSTHSSHLIHDANSPPGASRPTWPHHIDPTGAHVRRDGRYVRASDR